MLSPLFIFPFEIGAHKNKITFRLVGPLPALHTMIPNQFFQPFECEP